MINDPRPPPPIYFVNDPLPSWADLFDFVPLQALPQLVDQYEYLSNTLMLFLTCNGSQFSAISFSPYGCFNYIILHLKWLYNNM